MRMLLRVPRPERENKQAQNVAWRAKIVKAFVLHFRLCGWQKPEDPQIEPIANEAITRGSIGGLGSLVYICGSIPF